MFSYVCNMEMTKQQQIKKIKLEIKAREASIEVIQYLNRIDPDQKSNRSNRLSMYSKSLSVFEAELKKLLDTDVDYTIFLVSYTALTEQIRLLEIARKSDSSFAANQKVKKYVKARKQLKNAYLKENDITVSELNEMIENSLK